MLAVAAGAADVDGIWRRGDRLHPRAHGQHGTGDFFGGFAFVGEFDQRCGNLRIVHAAIEHPPEQRLGLGQIHAICAGLYPANLKEVRQQRMAMLGGDALGVELHAVDRMDRMAEAHDMARRRWLR